jgi:hypothetical protein
VRQRDRRCAFADGRCDSLDRAVWVGGLGDDRYGFFAFFAGFSERFATLVMGASERRLAPSEQRPPRSEANEDP